MDISGLIASKLPFQGWRQTTGLVLAFVLSSFIGSSGRRNTRVGFSMGPQPPTPETAEVELRIQGRGSVERLACDLMQLPAVISAEVNPPEE